MICDSFFTIIFKHIVYDLAGFEDDIEDAGAGAAADALVSQSPTSVIFIFTTSYVLYVFMPFYKE